jgi:putative heme iron utilization protein
MTDANLAAAARNLIEKANWLAFATTDDAGEPAASYAPFVMLEGGFGIVVSGLASHTAQMASRPRVALLFVSDAAPGDDVFARPRVSVEARVRPVIEREEIARIWNAFADRSSETTAILRTLPDFRTFVLEPLRGRVILGFGQAAELNATDLTIIVQ